MKGRIACFVFGVVVLGESHLLYAGGFEFPDQGTEALGRGAAFTAKADDATALIYNVAGFARQRGTRLLLNANLIFHSYSFQRSGVFPDDPTDPTTPYGGKPFDKVSDQQRVFPLPMIGISSDFGLDRWTFAIGAYGPSSIGKRSYPLTVNGRPNGGRYDVFDANLLVIYPTAVAAVRVTKWLELGASVQLVVSHFDLKSAVTVPIFRCPNLEYQPCDTTIHLHLNGLTAAAQVGAMVHPLRQLAIGVNVRSPINIDTEGTVSATLPKASPVNLPITPDKAWFHSRLPWVVRLGMRYIFEKQVKGETFEAGDLEVDGVYEAWGSAEGVGEEVDIPKLDPLISEPGIKASILHHYRDVWGARVGGAYNQRLPKGVLTLRGGAFFDSSATRAAATRVDFDTMEKFGFTVGLGYRIRGITLNAAYAYLLEPGRTVTNGEIRPTNGLDGTNVVDNVTLPVVNNGRYSANIQMLSLGVQIEWETLLGKKRKIRYQ